MLENLLDHLVNHLLPTFENLSDQLDNHLS